LEEGDFLVDKTTDIIAKRNKIWENNNYIPSWVNLETVGLEQFFTKPEVARKCYETFLGFLKREGANTDEYTFIEPSAGSGVFFNLLNTHKRIGFDIMPLCSGIKRQDFLSWYPETWNNDEKVQKYICIGNPPFGYRAWLALSFMRHASLFSDYIAMILPMAFQSDGKGSPKNRVENMRLVHTELLPKNSFYTPSGTKCSINALFQIWKKGKTICKKKATCKSWIDIFTVDMRKERLCGMSKMCEADFFLQRTYYDNPPQLVRDFSLVRYVCGYGLILKKEKASVKKVLDTADSNKYSNLAAHNCHHISMYHIEKVLIDRGYKDDRL
jgi:hypothetical protein